MKKYYVFLMTIFLFSCTKEATPPEEPKYFTSCEEMTDVTGLNLYQFEEPVQGIGIPELSKRQIPEDFLREMTTKELIYQISRLEVFTSIFFLALQGHGPWKYYVDRLNMCTDLMYKREDAVQTLLQLLQRIEPSFIKNGNMENDSSWDCYYFYECLQIFASCPAIINRMTDEEINQYIDEQIRLHDAISDLDFDANSDRWYYPHSIVFGLFGLCNIMMRYEFEPFLQLLETNEFFSDVIKDNKGETRWIIPQTLSIIDCIKKFQNQHK